MRLYYKITTGGSNYRTVTGAERKLFCTETYFFDFFSEYLVVCIQMCNKSLDARCQVDISKLREVPPPSSVRPEAFRAGAGWLRLWRWLLLLRAGTECLGFGRGVHRAPPNPGLQHCTSWMLDLAYPACCHLAGEAEVASLISSSIMELWLLFMGAAPLTTLGKRSDPAPLKVTVSHLPLLRKLLSSSWNWFYWALEITSLWFQQIPN